MCIRDRCQCLNKFIPQHSTYVQEILVKLDTQHHLFEKLSLLFEISFLSLLTITNVLPRQSRCDWSRLIIHSAYMFNAHTCTCTCSWRRRWGVHKGHSLHGGRSYGVQGRVGGKLTLHCRVGYYCLDTMELIWTPTLNMGSWNANLYIYIGIFSLGRILICTIMYIHVLWSVIGPFSKFI